MDPPTAVIWSAEARRELPARANRRRFVLDYFATRCCGGNISVGDLHLRWTASSEPIAEEFLPLRAPAGLEAYVQRDLIAVLEAAGAGIGIAGLGTAPTANPGPCGRHHVARIHQRLPDTQPTPSLIGDDRVLSEQALDHSRPRWQPERTQRVSCGTCRCATLSGDPPIISLL